MNGKITSTAVALLLVGLAAGGGLGYYLAPPKVVEKQITVEKQVMIGVQVGKAAPSFSLQSTLDRQVTLSEFKGKWLILFFFPAAYTPICQSEVQEFSRRLPEFQKINAVIVGVSVDNVTILKKWSADLGGIKYPLLSDTGGLISQRYGSFTTSSIQQPIKGKAVSMRGTFIIDPEGLVRYSLVHDELVGRSVQETLRVLDALQSGGACLVDWQPS